MSDEYQRELECWGDELLAEYGEGLPPARFETDGGARLLWFSKGLELGVRLASKVGLGGKIFIGKIYDENIHELSKTDRLEIAQAAYQHASVYWRMAHDKRARADRAAADREAALERLNAEVDDYKAMLPTIGSREQIRIFIDAVSADKAAASAAGNLDAGYLAANKLTLLYARLMELEKQEGRASRSGWWIGLIGTVSGLAGGAIGFFIGN